MYEVVLAELEITLGHQTFSNHFFFVLSEIVFKCSDILSILR